MSPVNLPDEMLIKIFRYLLDDQKSILRLRETCKRFCCIVNYKLLTAKHKKQFPSLEIYPGSECPGIFHPGRCIFNYEDDECECLQLRHSGNFKFVRFRRLAFSDLENVRDCTLDALSLGRSNFLSITELDIKRCYFDLITFNEILTYLPNVKRLILSETFFDEAATPEKGKLAIRTLVHISLDSNEGREVGIMDYLLNFPTIELELHQTDLTWLERYLTRHNKVTKRVKFYLNEIDDGSDDEGVLAAAQRSRQEVNRAYETIIGLGYYLISPPNLDTFADDDYNVIILQ